MPDSNSRRWRFGLRIAKFVAFCAADLLIPDWITKPFTYLKKFHQTFICTTLQDRLSLFAEAEEVTDANRQEVISLMVAELRETVPNDVPDAQLRDFCSKLLDSLRDANSAEKQGQNSNQKLKESLSRSFLANLPLKLEKPNLSNDQEQLGKLRVSAVLQGDPKPKTKFSFNLNELPKLADYQFLQPIGEGGFARVYKALHKPTNEIRAIKIGTITEPDRFDRELKIVESLNDPRLLKYHEHGKFNADKSYWIAMEYLGEQTLEDVMKLAKFRKQTENITLICEQVLKGLAALHHAGVIHRDIKPSNIMFDSQNSVKLIDYGLAKPLDNQQDMLSTKSIGKMVGTPFYMSPEQLRANKRLTPASDIYSFAIVTTEMFTGNNPNAAETLADVILKACMQVPKLEGSNVPEELHGVLLECLQIDSSKRPDNAKVLLPKWESAKTPLLAKIRFERDQPSWLKILNENLLSAYLIQCEKSSRMPDPKGFNRFIAQKGVKSVSSKRLTEVLFPLYNAHLEIVDAERRLNEMKVKFSQDAPTLSSTQMSERLQGVQTAEKTVSQKQQEYNRIQEKTLGRETNSWQALLDDQKRQEAEKKSWEEERLEIIRRAEREEQLAFEEITRQKNKRDEQARREKQAKQHSRHVMIQILSVIAVAILGCIVMCGGCLYLISPNKTPVNKTSAQKGTESTSFKGSASKGNNEPSSSEGKKPAFGIIEDISKPPDANKGNTSYVTSVAFSPDGKHILTGRGDFTSKVWNAEKGEELFALKGHTQVVNSVTWSPDSKRIITGSQDNTSKVWDAEKGIEVFTLKGHTQEVTSVAFSPDSKRILTGSYDKTAKVWDAEKGIELFALKGHTQVVTSVTWSPDGKHILTGSGDKTAKVWDAEKGIEILTLKGHTIRVDSVKWSPEGKHILTGSEDRTAKVWNAEKGQEILTLRGHTERVISVSWSPDGKRILTGSRDNTAKVWDAEKGQEVFTLHTREMINVAFSRDGKRIISVDIYGTLNVWDAK